MNDDRLVIVFSHHGIDTLTNTRAHPGPDGVPLLGAADVVALLHRFGNVVLWLNGHTHTNAIRSRRDPRDPTRGFWEVTTCAVVDWPCQTRAVELVDADGHLSIVCTMIDHDTPVAASSLATGSELASLHRELAANMPGAGADSGGAGTTADRNVVLRLAPPFPLGRLTALAHPARRRPPARPSWRRPGRPSSPRILTGPKGHTPVPTRLGFDLMDRRIHSGKR
jgi:hypothetical protein